MIIKRKQFSGYPEVSSTGVSYIHSPNKNNPELSSESVYILDSADKIIDVVDNSYVGKIHAVNKKTSLFKRALRPTKDYILYRRHKNQEREN